LLTISVTFSVRVSMALLPNGGCVTFTITRICRADKLRVCKTNPCTGSQRRSRRGTAPSLAAMILPLATGYRDQVTDTKQDFLSMIGTSSPEAADGQATLTMDAEDRHLNAAGTVHGGMLATLVDATMGAAIRSAVDDETPATS